MLILGALSLLLAMSAWWPVRAPAGAAAVWFFAGWLGGELALHVVAIEAAVTWLLVGAGALGTVHGAIGVGLAIASWALLLAFYTRGLGMRRLGARALDEGLGAGYPVDPAREQPRSAAGTLRQLALPLPVAHAGVESFRHIPFATPPDGPPLRLDVHRSARRPGGCPVIVYVHGGGWTLGYRRYQGLPLLKHLAARGWVAFSLDYRLCPRATFPEPLVDVKQGLAWVRAHAHEYGGDPSFILLAGNSSGAHLSALAALTPNDPRYQPGFEGADTRVDGCMTFYGPYDLVDRNGHWPNPGFEWLVERWLFKCGRAASRERFVEASPIDRVHARRPPFLVVHGERDSLVPVAESRHFVRALREVPGAPVCYLEVPGAQHAFDVFPSPRALCAVDTAARFATWLHGRWLAERDATARADSAARSCA